MLILHRNNILLLSIWISFTCIQKVAIAASTTDDKDLLYFDDDQQSDPIEGSAEDGHFSNKDVSSGNKEDDEEDTGGSGHGSDLDVESDGGSGGIVLLPEPAPPLSTLTPVSSTTDQPTTVQGTTPSTTTYTSPPTTTSSTTTTRPTKKYEPSTKKTPYAKPPPAKVPPDFENRIPDLVTTSEPEDDEDMNNEVNIIMGHRQNNQPSAFFGQPGMLAAVIGGIVVGLLFAILLAMFIVYRMRKKDEGSYPLDEPKRSPTSNSYSRSTNKEFYA